VSLTEYRGEIIYLPKKTSSSIEFPFTLRNKLAPFPRVGHSTGAWSPTDTSYNSCFSDRENSTPEIAACAAIERLSKMAEKTN
jgi:hypothetical protein